MTAPVSATQAQAILQLLAEAANQHLQSQFAPPPPPSPPLAPAHSPRTTTTTKKRTTRHSSSSRTTNPSPLSTSHTPSQSLPSLEIAQHSDIIHPPTDTDDAEPTEEQEDPATLLFNDYFDFPSSDEDDDPDFLPRLTPADSTTGQPTPLTQGQVEQDDEEEEDGRDWWADVFGRGVDESEDEEDEDDDEEEEEVVGLTREEFEKELALLTGEVEGFNTLNQNQPGSRERERGNHDRIASVRDGDTPDASNLTATPSTTTTKTSKKRSSSKKSKDSSQPIPSDDPTPRTSPRRKRTSTDSSSLEQDEEPERRPTKKLKSSSSSSSKKSKKSRPLSPPALSPIPELATFAPPPPHNSRLPSTLSPDPPPIASTSTSKLTSTGEPKKLRPRAIYTEEEAKERRKAQERERQARKRAKAIEDKEAMEQKIKLLEFSLGEWKTRATTAEKRVRELLEVERRERGRREREEADEEEEEEESDGGEFVMEENGREEGDSTEESSSEEEEDDEDGEDGDQVTRMVDEGRGLETELGQPQMDLNLSNLGQGDLNQLLALVQNAAMAQGIQLEGSSNGARAGGG